MEKDAERGGVLVLSLFSLFHLAGEGLLRLGASREKGGERGRVPGDGGLALWPSFVAARKGDWVFWAECSPGLLKRFLCVDKRIFKVWMVRTRCLV